MARRATLRVGLHSTPERLARADGRTGEGRLLKMVRQELVAHVGGSPSTPQAMLIEVIALKAMRLGMVSEAYKAGAGELGKVDETFLKLSGSLREDLRLLGMERPAQEAPSLVRYLEGRTDKAA